MKPYQKISILILRLVGSLVILFGAAYFTTLLLQRLAFDGLQFYPWFTSPTEKGLLLNGFHYIVIGGVIFLLSNTIGKALARGLDD